MRPFSIVALALAVGWLGGLARGSGREPGGGGPEEAQRPRMQRNDLLRISGSFEVVYYESNGAAYPAATLKTMKVIQKESDWDFHSGGTITSGKDVIVAIGTHFAHIDSTYTTGPLKGRKILGIVKVEADRVTYCWAGHGEPRPTAFVTAPESGLTLCTLQRLPEGRKAP